MLITERVTSAMEPGMGHGAAPSSELWGFHLTGGFGKTEFVFQTLAYRGQIKEVSGPTISPKEPLLVNAWFQQGSRKDINDSLEVKGGGGRMECGFQVL